jgi:fructoselysine 6-kinase
VLTLGAEGSIAIKNGEMTRQQALPLDKVVDTTGCGDAFQAGFSAEYFKTRDIRKSLLSGAAAGREAAMDFGGVPW